MADKVALIGGVTGIVGMNLANRLLKEGWKVYGISRRRPDYMSSQVKHLSVDLTDGGVCKKKLQDVNDVKYLFFTAWVNKGNEEDNCVVNKQIVENLLDNLPSKLKHVVLVTGIKHYTGSFDSFEQTALVTPFRERQPRHSSKNFYYDQEDAMFERAASQGFTWSIARPSTIIGFAPNNQMNSAMNLAVYASICKHTGRPFFFPGGMKGGYDIFLDATDAELLAENLVWQATTPDAVNQAFNIVNGDTFRWRTMWNVLVEYFDLSGQAEDPPEHPLNMEEEMKDMGPVWDEIVEKHGLKKYKIEELTNWWFTSLDLGRDRSCLTDMSKLRKAGWTRYVDTEESFVKVFDFMRKEKYIP